MNDELSVSQALKHIDESSKAVSQAIKHIEESETSSSVTNSKKNIC